MPFPKFHRNPEQESGSTPAKAANPLNTPVGQRPGSAEHQHQPEPERKPPQLAGWAAGLLEGADKLGLRFPLLVELVEPEDGIQSLTRLASSRAELERILAELSRYMPSEGHLRAPRTLESLWSFINV